MFHIIKKIYLINDNIFKNYNRNFILKFLSNKSKNNIY